VKFITAWSIWAIMPQNCRRTLFGTSAHLAKYSGSACRGSCGAVYERYLLNQEVDEYDDHQGPAVVLICMQDGERNLFHMNTRMPSSHMKNGSSLTWNYGFAITQASRKHRFSGHSHEEGVLSVVLHVVARHLDGPVGEKRGGVDRRVDVALQVLLPVPQVHHLEGHLPSHRCGGISVSAFSTPSPPATATVMMAGTTDLVSNHHHDTDVTPRTQVAQG
jgi:hypothetical protein